MANSTVPNEKSPLLLKVMVLIGKLEFHESWIAPNHTHYTDGSCDENNLITVNPIPSVVDTIIHECLHALYPDYSERAVLSLTGKLMKQLTSEDMQTIYGEYRRKVILSPELEAAEDERTNQ
jgi:hypothetical protein